MQKILIVFGTRPEVIKMAPIVNALNAADSLHAEVCVTAQHRQMIDHVLGLFQVKPEYDLNIMKPGQDLTNISSNILLCLRRSLLNEGVNEQHIHVTGNTVIDALQQVVDKLKKCHFKRIVSISIRFS